MRVVPTPVRAEASGDEILLDDLQGTRPPGEAIVSGRPAKPVPLGYSFAPVPTWIFADLETGAITESDFVLIAFVYRRAKTEKLKARAETPRLSVEEIATRTRSKPDTVSKRLRRLRGRYFDERVEGTRATGYVRVFRLFPNPPEPSEHRPTKTAASGPTKTAAENGSGSGIETSRAADPSDHPERAIPASGPTEPASGPTKTEAANPLGEPVRAPSSAEPVRPSLDVVERANALTEEGLRVERLSQDYLQGEETSRASEPSRTNDDRLLAIFEETRQARAERERRERHERFQAHETGTDR